MLDPTLHLPAKSATWRIRAPINPYIGSAAIDTSAPLPFNGYEVFRNGSEGWGNPPIGVYIYVQSRGELRYAHTPYNIRKRDHPDGYPAITSKPCATQLIGADTSLG